MMSRRWRRYSQIDFVLIGGVLRRIEVAIESLQTYVQHNLCFIFYTTSSLFSLHTANFAAQF